MAALVPAIHVHDVARCVGVGAGLRPAPTRAERKTWMAATSAAMTEAAPQAPNFASLMRLLASRQMLPERSTIAPAPNYCLASTLRSERGEGRALMQGLII